MSKVTATVITTEPNDDKSIKIIYQVEGSPTPKRTIFTKAAIAKAISESDNIVQAMQSGIKGFTISFTCKKGKGSAPKL